MPTDVHEMRRCSGEPLDRRRHRWCYGFVKGRLGRSLSPGHLLGATLALLVAVSAHATPLKQSVKANASRMSASRLMEWGKRHEHGVGADQDMDRAIQFYCRAAAQGEAEALYRLGWIYATGRAGKVDEVLGAAWFQAAAAAKYPRASQQIASLGAGGLDLDQTPECVLSGEMVARRIPRTPRSPRTGIASKTSSSLDSSVVVRDLEKKDIKGLVRRLAPDYRLDADLVLAVIEAESNFNPAARSPKNAQGLMQLIPATASRFGVKNVWDPVDNLRGGMSYLRWLLDHFDGDVELALAGYNAGEQAVHQYRGIPPYPETQGYVKRITRKLRSGKASKPSRLRSFQSDPLETTSIGTGDGPMFKTIEVSNGSS
jgi:soluble lytic murein transglycosylase-like protein